MPETLTDPPGPTELGVVTMSAAQAGAATTSVEHRIAKNQSLFMLHPLQAAFRARGHTGGTRSSATRERLERTATRLGFRVDTLARGGCATCWFSGRPSSGEISFFAFVALCHLISHNSMGGLAPFIWCLAKKGAGAK